MRPRSRIEARGSERLICQTTIDLSMPAPQQWPLPISLHYLSLHALMAIVIIVLPYVVRMELAPAPKCRFAVQNKHSPSSIALRRGARTRRSRSNDTRIVVTRLSLFGKASVNKKLKVLLTMMPPTSLRPAACRCWVFIKDPQAIRADRASFSGRP